MEQTIPQAPVKKAWPLMTDTTLATHNGLDFHRIVARRYDDALSYGLTTYPLTLSQLLSSPLGKALSYLTTRRAGMAHAHP